MGTRADNIIKDAEQDAGKTLDLNWEGLGHYLCDDDTCRHPECECWEWFANAVANQLDNQPEETK